MPANNQSRECTSIDEWHLKNLRLQFVIVVYKQLTHWWAIVRFRAAQTTSIEVHFKLRILHTHHILRYSDTCTVKRSFTNKPTSDPVFYGNFRHWYERIAFHCVSFTSKPAVIRWRSTIIRIAQIRSLQRQLSPIYWTFCAWDMLHNHSELISLQYMAHYCDNLTICFFLALVRSGYFTTFNFYRFSVLFRCELSTNMYAILIAIECRIKEMCIPHLNVLTTVLLHDN